MTTKFSRESRVSHERSFNLDSLERNHWRNRINQLKRELRESPYSASRSASSSASSASSASVSSSADLSSSRPQPRRRPSR